MIDNANQQSTPALAGQAALITGGAGNFGRACARLLARDGAAVTLMDRAADDLHDAAQEIRAAVPGARVEVFVGDATVEKDVQAAFAATSRDDLRIVVCTVGGGTMAPLMALQPAAFEADFQLNTTSALHAIRHAVPLMVANGGGSIVCVSSSAAGHSMPFLTSYAVAKSALEALIRSAADELGRLGVRVNAVRPGYVPPRGAEGRPADSLRASAVSNTKPLTKVGTAEDIAHAVRYLAGPESAWVTGTSMPVEGGSHLRAAVNQEAVARLVCGDAVVSRALRGELVCD